jgi:MoaA/NifB/PqqE/SkfB family radical SAM enzyme
MCGHWRDTEANKKELSYETIEKLLKDVVPHKSHITLSGGEPTLRKDLPQIIKLASDLGLETTLHTNASRLNMEYVEEIIQAGVTHIGISVDSAIEDIQDSIRGCPGLFQKQVQGIQNIKQVDPSMTIHVNATVMSSNYKDIDLMIPFCDEHGIASLTVVLMRTYSSIGEYNFVNHLPLNKQQLREFYQETIVRMFENLSPLHRNVRPLPNEVLQQTLIQDPDYGEIVEFLKDDQKMEPYIENFSQGLYGKTFVESNHCPRPLYKLEIDSEGKVTTCCATYCTYMGNIHEKGIQEIWDSEEYTQFRRCSNLPRAGICLRCNAFVGVPAFKIMECRAFSKSTANQ